MSQDSERSPEALIVRRDLHRLALRRIIPARVRMFREAKGWSKAHLASVAKLAASTIVDIEGGQLLDVQLSTIFKLGAALDMSLNALTGYDTHVAQLDHLIERVGGPFILPALTVQHIRDGIQFRCLFCGALLHPGVEHWPTHCAEAHRCKGHDPAHMGRLYEVGRSSAREYLGPPRK